MFFMYVHYGCGMRAPKSWRNFDCSPTLRFERIPLVGKLYTKNKTRFPNNVEYGDIVKGLPVPEQSCDGVYACAVLEHLSLADFRIALKNTYKILRPGGLFRFLVPDLRPMIDEYIRSKDPSASIGFVQQTELGYEKRPTGFQGRLSQHFGNARHLWVWDFESLRVELQNANFIEIRRCSYGDSTDSMFMEVDNPDWYILLAVECRKG